MKHLLQRRLLPVFLCMMLALGLTACGGKDAQDASLLCGHDTAPFSVSLHISRPPELILRSLPRCSRPCGAGIHREDRAL